MSVGPTAYLVNKLLDLAFRNVAWTPPAIVYVRGHVGDPGAAGTANASTQTTRYATSWAAAASGLINISGTPEITLIGTETISHVSYWDSPTNGAGNCLWTAQASVAKAGAANDIIRITTAQLGFTGLAA
ncbi:head protein [Mycobacterium phage MOOREtheMARYer]|uniref:Uncharacterized protein n=1 Tax=Mycobacterium phage MOOREtheMARYer TaxID=1647309 RepID=A0A0F6YS42_9CAUD|nr:head protein [Mycobacterium phage MOOREtheMARYer]AKF14886.1 hypothetical protein SEA_MOORETHEMARYER_25 [Mycobacterium phage MOOREtheMARYer]